MVGKRHFHRPQMHLCLGKGRDCPIYIFCKLCTRFPFRLQGCEPVDILLVKRDGRFSGEAFVVLGSPLQIQMAVDKNKSYMGRRYVEVFRAKKLVRPAAVDAGL